jgi:hypothetical protein
LPDFSAINPGWYLNAKHVPYLGWAFDNTCCSTKPTTKIYGVRFNRCLVPADPPAHASWRTRRLRPDAINCLLATQCLPIWSAVKAAGYKGTFANQTWQIKGFVGPVKYPASTVAPQPFCQTVVEDADGTSWKTVVPFTCSSKTFKVK